MIDEYTLDCSAIEVDRSFAAVDVIGVLRYPFTVRRTPKICRATTDRSSWPALFDVELARRDVHIRLWICSVSDRMILDAQFLCGGFVAFVSSKFWYIHLIEKLTLFCKLL